MDDGTNTTTAPVMPGEALDTESTQAAINAQHETALAAHGESIDALRDDLREVHAKIDAALHDITERIESAISEAPVEADNEDDETPHPLTVKQRLTKIEERLFGAFVG